MSLNIKNCESFSKFKVSYKKYLLENEIDSNIFLNDTDLLLSSWLALSIQLHLFSCLSLFTHTHIDYYFKTISKHYYSKCKRVYWCYLSSFVTSVPFTEKDLLMTHNTYIWTAAPLLCMRLQQWQPTGHFQYIHASSVHPSSAWPSLRRIENEEAEGKASTCDRGPSPD